MDDDQRRQEQREALREIARIHREMTDPAPGEIRKVKWYVFFKAIYMFTLGISLWVLAIRMPFVPGVVLKILMIGWTAWIVWFLRPRPCVVCGRKSRTPVPSFSFVRQSFLDVRPMPRHMLVYACSEHRDELSLIHLLRRSHPEPLG